MTWHMYIRRDPGSRNHTASGRRGEHISRVSTMAYVEEELAEINDLIRWGDPSYTYVLNFPLQKWKGDEYRIQRALGSPSFHDLDNGELFLHMPGPDEPDRQSEFLAHNGPFRSYSVILAKAVSSAGRFIFKQRQGTVTPTCSIFAQAEIGKEKIHVHLVLSGAGLNKYTAKAWTNQLGYHWATRLVDHCRAVLEMDNCPDKIMCQQLLNLFEAERVSCMSDRSKLASIMQYKNRNGEMYACRVNGPEYICNYLLCKNLKWYYVVSPELATPHVSYFVGASGTYAVSLLNDKFISLHCRRQWVDNIKKYVSRDVEPVFTGELFGTLPEVSKSGWDARKSGECMNDNPQKITKREKLMLDCLKRCEDERLTTYEDLVNKCPELVVMLEATSGGSKLIDQMLGMVHIKMSQKYTALTYVQSKYEKEELEPDNKAWQLMLLQGYNPWQVGHWLCCVLDKKAGKQNTINFYGPASTGKTNIAKAIVNCVGLYGCVNHQNRNFVFNDCAAKLILWWEECLMHSDWVEQAKCIMGGTTFRIDRKHRDSMLLPQTPLIVSTNNDIYSVTGGNTVTGVHAKPLRERVVQLNMMKQLSSTFGEIDPREIAAWLQACMTRFQCDLNGFYSQWGLERTPNDFPLNKLCAGHDPQEFVLHETGICSACGGYYPLETRDRGQPEPAQPQTITGISLVSSLLHEDASWLTDGAPLTEDDLNCVFAESETVPVEEPPKKKRRKEKHQVITDTDWSSQPKDELEIQLWEQSLRQEPEQSTGQDEGTSESVGLSPSEWGELLGIIEGDISSGEPPITLHCFEDINWDEI
ncbi:nonstructural protein 1 [Mink bocavirus]|nr:nonstructural protein 1 [Mink bocavirus]WES71965.1 non-structural protein 1 [Mink bocavirus]WES71968.1 non-structural protein 1 [Mink bocavirus]WES71974.1 non-structural protein 1 [Mink bocavirus]WES71977.1 non-structural protein 1 [Mink bocavirus]